MYIADEKFLGYVGMNVESLCVEFRIFFSELYIFELYNFLNNLRKVGLVLPRNSCLVYEDNVTFHEKIQDLG
jgi:hypothetical protein